MLAEVGVTVGIDTVAFRVPVELSEERLGRAGFKLREVVDLGSGQKERTYFREPGESRLLLQYRPGVGLRVEGSWPKFLYGENVVPVTWVEFGMACREVGLWLEKLLGVHVDVSKAKPTRVDYVCDLSVGPEMVSSYVRAFAGLRWLRMSRSVYGAGVMHHAGDRTFRAYDKYAESRNSKAVGVCRYEFQLRGTEGIARALVPYGVERREQAVKDLAEKLLLGEAVELQYGVVLRLLMEGLKNGSRKIRLTAGDLIELELLAKLRDDMPRAFRLAGFVRMAGVLGAEGLKEVAKERTFYRYRRELEKLGLNLDWDKAQEIWENVALEIDLGPVLEQLERFRENNGGVFYPVKEEVEAG